MRDRLERRFPNRPGPPDADSFNAKAQRGGAATKRKRPQRRDAENAESRRAFSLTTDGHLRDRLKPGHQTSNTQLSTFNAGFEDEDENEEEDEAAG
jgi:hypothetical protein